MDLSELIVDLAELRAEANARMVDTCTVRQPSTVGDLDQSTGERPTIAGALVYGNGPTGGGICEIQDDGLVTQQVTSGGHAYSVSRLMLKFPVSAPRITEGLEVTIDASPISPHNIGRKFQVLGPGEKTFTTAQRVAVKEIVDA